VLLLQLLLSEVTLIFDRCCKFDPAPVACRFTISLRFMTWVGPERQSRSWFWDFVFASRYLLVTQKFSKDLPMAHDPPNAAMKCNGKKNRRIEGFISIDLHLNMLK
jgi:hypothetical protein